MRIVRDRLFEGRAGKKPPKGGGARGRRARLLLPAAKKLGIAEIKGKGGKEKRERRTTLLREVRLSLSRGQERWKVRSTPKA